MPSFILIASPFFGTSACAGETGAAADSAQVNPDASGVANPTPKSTDMQRQREEALRREDLEQYVQFANACRKLDTIFSSTGISDAQSLLSGEIAPLCAEIDALCGAHSPYGKSIWRQLTSTGQLCGQMRDLCQFALTMPPDEQAPAQQTETSFSQTAGTLKNAVIAKISRFHAAAKSALACELPSDTPKLTVYDACFEARFGEIFSTLGLTPAKSNPNQDNAQAHARHIACQDGDCRAFVEKLHQSSAQSALAFLARSAQTLIANRYVSQESLLAEETDEFFKSGDAQAAEKLAVTLELLPARIAHAQMSDAGIAARSLFGAYKSLARNPNAKRIAIACTARDGATEHEIRFNFGDVFELNSAVYAAKTALSCPDPNPDIIPNAPFPDNKTLSCRTELAPFERKPNIDIILNQLRLSLRAKDNTSIAQGMIELSHALAYRANRFQSIEDADFCPIFNLYLAALSQDRFAELDSLEKQLKRIYRDDFPERLIKHKTCLSHPDEVSAALAQDLWSQNGEKYTWIASNFSDKARKKIEKSFKQWTKTRNLSVKQPRQMIASWAAWTLGDTERALRFSEGMTKKKPLLVHPQINAFDAMLKYSNAQPLGQGSLESFIRATSLKTPSLPYQTFSAIADKIPKAEKKRIAAAMQSLQPAIAPAAAADFFIAFSDEIFGILSPKQRIAAESWIDAETAEFTTGCASVKRRLRWVSDAARLNMQAEIEKRAEYFAQMQSNSPATRALWKQIACVAHNPDEPNIIDICLSSSPTRSSCDACQSQKSRSGAEYLNNLSECWTP